MRSQRVLTSSQELGYKLSKWEQRAVKTAMLSELKWEPGVCLSTPKKISLLKQQWWLLVAMNLLNVMICENYKWVYWGRNEMWWGWCYEKIINDAWCQGKYLAITACSMLSMFSCRTLPVDTMNFFFIVWHENYNIVCHEEFYVVGKVLTDTWDSFHKC